MQQGPFAPRALPRFNATTDPAATVSSSTVFPGPPVMRSTLLRRFLDGTRTASPVAWHVLVTVLSLPPRQRDVPHQIVWRHILLPSSDTRKFQLALRCFRTGVVDADMAGEPHGKDLSSIAALRMNVFKYLLTYLSLPFNRSEWI